MAPAPEKSLLGSIVNANHTTVPIIPIVAATPKTHRNTVLGGVASGFQDLETGREGDEVIIQAFEIIFLIFLVGAAVLICASCICATINRYNCQNNIRPQRSPQGCGPPGGGNYKRNTVYRPTDCGPILQQVRAAREARAMRPPFNCNPSTAYSSTGAAYSYASAAPFPSKISNFGPGSCC